MRIKQFLKKLLQQLQALRFAKQPFLAPAQHEVGEVFVFIRTWERPLYLWTCLDNLYRNTPKVVKFVLIDNASSDPLVREIITAFEQREMFHAVHYMDRNHGANQQLVFKKYEPKLGKYFFLLDADIVIQTSNYAWTTILIDQAERYPDLSLIGSYIDVSDFVSLEKAQQIAPELQAQQLEYLIKAQSVERHIPPKNKEIIQPFSPPGRLLLARTSVIKKVGLPIGNTNLCQAVKNAGYQYGISTRVVHRHLSLLNIYDYPNYDFKQLAKYLSGR